MSDLRCNCGAACVNVGILLILWDCMKLREVLIGRRSPTDLKGREYCC